VAGRDATTRSSVAEDRGQNAVGRHGLARDNDHRTAARQDQLRQVVEQVIDLRVIQVVEGDPPVTRSTRPGIVRSASTRIVAIRPATAASATAAASWSRYGSSWRIRLDGADAWRCEPDQ
jgi:hypothetical protein